MGEHQLPFHMNVDGNKKPTYSTTWERAVAYHHGLYVPEKYQSTTTADDIRLTVADFSDKVHKDSPKDACKYQTQPEVAAKKCMKWWTEMQKCQWDQAKFN